MSNTDPVTLPKLFVAVLNWNNWSDTIRCLESIFHNDYPDYQVIVIDNGSTDGSVEKITEWAAGRSSLSVDDGDLLSHLFYPEVQKPIVCKVLDMSGGKMPPEIPDVSLIIAKSGENLGFAKGNNLAISFVTALAPEAYIFVLGNDAAIPQNFLTTAMKDLVHGQAQDVSVLGFPQYAYSNPDFLMVACFKEEFTRGPIHQTNFPEGVGSILKGVMIHGGAMLITPKSPVRLIPEDYFLYYEDADFCNRIHERGGLIGVQTANPVYEKGGGSTGRNSPLQIYYTRRNKLFYSMRFHSTPEFLIVFVRMLVSTSISVGKCVLRRDSRRAKAYILAVIHFLQGKRGRGWKQT